MRSSLGWDVVAIPSLVAAALFVGVLGSMGAFVYGQVVQNQQSAAVGLLLRCSWGRSSGRERRKPPAAESAQRRRSPIGRWERRSPASGRAFHVRSSRVSSAAVSTTA